MENFQLACDTGDITLLKEVDFNYVDKLKLNSGFRDAAKNGHLNIVQYLLTSEELKVHANIYYGGFTTFLTICSAGQIHIADYLLNSPELKENIVLTEKTTYLLKVAARADNINLLDYLVKSPKTSPILLQKETIVDTYYTCCIYEHVESLRYIISNQFLGIPLSKDILTQGLACAMEKEKFKILDFFVLDYHTPLSHQDILNFINDPNISAHTYKKTRDYLLTLIRYDDLDKKLALEHAKNETVLNKI